MSENLKTISKDIHSKLASYLPLKDVISLSKTCGQLQSIYRQISWKKCAVLSNTTQSISVDSSFEAYPTYRLVSGTVFANPSKYKWFLNAEICECFVFVKWNPALLSNSDAGLGDIEKYGISKGDYPVLEKISFHQWRPSFFNSSFFQSLGLNFVVPKSQAKGRNRNVKKSSRNKNVATKMSIDIQLISEKSNSNVNVSFSQFVSKYPRLLGSVSKLMMHKFHEANIFQSHTRLSLQVDFNLSSLDLRHSDPRFARSFLTRPQRLPNLQNLVFQLTVIFTLGFPPLCLIHKEDEEILVLLPRGLKCCHLYMSVTDEMPLNDPLYSYVNITLKNAPVPQVNQLSIQIFEDRPRVFKFAALIFFQFPQLSVLDYFDAPIPPQSRYEANSLHRSFDRLELNSYTLTSLSVCNIGEWDRTFLDFVAGLDRLKHLTFSIAHDVSLTTLSMSKAATLIISEHSVSPEMWNRYTLLDSTHILTKAFQNCIRRTDDFFSSCNVLVSMAMEYIIVCPTQAYKALADKLELEFEKLGDSRASCCIIYLFAFYESLFSIVSSHRSIESFVFGSRQGFYFSPRLQQLLRPHDGTLKQVVFAGRLRTSPAGYYVRVHSKIFTSSQGVFPDSSNLTHFETFSLQKKCAQYETLDSDVSKDSTDKYMVAVYENKGYHKFGIRKGYTFHPSHKQAIRDMQLSSLHEIFP